MNKILTVLILILLWSGCAKNTLTDVSTTDCNTVTGTTFITNGGQMHTLITTQCSGNKCHSSGGSESRKFLVTDNYTSIKSSLTTAARSVLNGSMPQGSSLSTDELQKWQCWSTNGFPQ